MKEKRILNEFDFGVLDEYLEMILAYLEDIFTRVTGDEQRFCSVLRQYLSDSEVYFTSVDERKDKV